MSRPTLVTHNPYFFVSPDWLGSRNIDKHTKLAYEAALQQAEHHELYRFAENGAQVLVRSRDFVIGRLGELVVPAMHEKVASEHCKIEFHGGEWCIRDLTANRSTFILRRGKTNRLPENTPVPLLRGDTFFLGCMAHGRPTTAEDLRGPNIFVFEVI